MSVLEILLKAAGSGVPSLVALLQKAEAYPDLAPLAAKWLAALQTDASPSNLANVGAAVVRELGDIGQGKLNPRSHPGDAT